MTDLTIEPILTVSQRLKKQKKNIIFRGMYFSGIFILLVLAKLFLPIAASIPWWVVAMPLIVLSSMMGLLFMILLVITIFLKIYEKQS